MLVPQGGTYFHVWWNQLFVSTCETSLLWGAPWNGWGRGVTWENRKPVRCLNELVGFKDSCACDFTGTHKVQRHLDSLS